jgi:ArsR family transcriptional regulator, arsenate/arsenite/antimonite-responsive transcriptional repressor
MNTVAILKALSDETRLRIISLILAAGDLCACEVETILGLNQSNASRHFGRLLQTGLIVSQKKGQWVHYASGPLEEPRLGFVRDAVHSARQDSERLKSDLARLGDYRASGFSCRTIKDWRPSGDALSGNKITAHNYSA